MSVTPDDTIIANAAAGSQLGSITCVAPAAVAVQTAQASARWNIGAACSQTSLPVTASSSRVMARWAPRLARVSTTPLARPVVPLV